MPEISEKALKEAKGRFGNPLVEETLEYLISVLKRQGTKPYKATRKECFACLDPLRENEKWARDLQNRRLQVASVLFQDSSEAQANLQSLVKEFGVSEPATVPRQTSRAEVTPKERKFGKSF